MTETSHKQRGRQLVDDALNAHRPERLDEFLAEAFRTHLPGTSAGADREAYRAQYEALLDAFPDLSYEIAAEVAQGDKVAYRLRGTGTHGGAFFGTDGSGKTATWDEMHLFRFGPDGTIVEHWGLWDTASIMMQLGMMPAVDQW